MDQAEQVFQPIRAIVPRRWTSLDQSRCLSCMFDGLYPPGLGWYWSADFVIDMSDEGIDLHVQEGQERVQAAYRDHYPRLAQVTALPAS